MHAKNLLSKAAIPIILFAIFLFSVFQATSSEEILLPEGAKVSEKVFGLSGLSNVGRVDPGVYRGAQPKPEGYATLKKMGIKTVINLRAWHSDKNTVEESGMQSIEIPMNTYSDVNKEKVKKAISIMADPASQPVFIHCQHGKDRTGVVIAIYRMEVDGWSREDVEAEMKSFGFNDIWHELKEFVRDYPVSKRK